MNTIKREPFKWHLSTTQLECMNQLKQSIHNLEMRWPCGIKSIDDEANDKLKRLKQLLKEIYERN